MGILIAVARQLCLKKFTPLCQSKHNCLKSIIETSCLKQNSSPILNMKSLKSLCHNVGLTLVGALTLAAASTASQAQKAAAIDLNFSNPVGTGPVTNVGSAGLGSGFTGSSIRYNNVATDTNGTVIYALVNATVTGTNYSFVGHIPAYNSTTANGAAEPNDDASFLYQINTGTGRGGMNYTISLFDAATNNPYTASALSFLVYDVDGENPNTSGPGTTSQSTRRQDEAFRIAKNSGLIGYQVGSSAQALAVTQDASSYLFTGPGTNYLETDSTGAALLFFQNVNSVTFGFEANTLPSFNASTGLPNTNATNSVFSALDGDLSYLPSFGGTGSFAPRVDTSATAGGSTAVPEPFTIVGTLIGGTAAVRMRKKLKATTKI